MLLKYIDAWQRSRPLYVYVYVTDARMDVRATHDGRYCGAVVRCRTHEAGIVNDDLDVVRSLGDTLRNARLDDGWVAPRDDSIPGDSEPDHRTHIATRLGGQRWTRVPARDWRDDPADLSRASPVRAGSWSVVSLGGASVA